MNNTSKDKGVVTRERILQAIIEFIQKNGYSPTYEEIMAMCNIKSKSTVCTHIQRMHDQGMLEVYLGSPRAIRVPGYRFVKEDAAKTNYDRIRSMSVE